MTHQWERRIGGRRWPSACLGRLLEDLVGRQDVQAVMVQDPLRLVLEDGLWEGLHDLGDGCSVLDLRGPAGDQRCGEHRRHALRAVPLAVFGWPQLQ